MKLRVIAVIALMMIIKASFEVASGPERSRFSPPQVSGLGSRGLLGGLIFPPIRTQDMWFTYSGLWEELLPAWLGGAFICAITACLCASITHRKVPLWGLYGLLGGIFPSLVLILLRPICRYCKKPIGLKGNRTKGTCEVCEPPCGIESMKTCLGCGDRYDSKRLTCPKCGSTAWRLA